MITRFGLRIGSARFRYGLPGIPISFRGKPIHFCPGRIGIWEIPFGLHGFPIGADGFPFFRSVFLIGKRQKRMSY